VPADAWRKRSDTAAASLSRLNAIVDVEAALRAGRTAAALTAAFLAGGARFLQLRAKPMTGAAMLDAATRLVNAARQVGATVIVNDRADIARLSGADGVHVGQDDLAPSAVRRIVGDDAIVGLSTHTIDQVEAAVLEPVNYVAIGPIYGTSSKAVGYDPVGLDLVRAASVRTRARGLSLVPIRGITIDRAPDVIRAGADAVAVIGDLLSGSPEERVRDYVARLAAIGRV